MRSASRAAGVVRILEAQEVKDIAHARAGAGVAVAGVGSARVVAVLEAEEVEDVQDARAGRAVAIGVASGAERDLQVVHGGVAFHLAAGLNVDGAHAVAAVGLDKEPAADRELAIEDLRRSEHRRARHVLDRHDRAVEGTDVELDRLNGGAKARVEHDLADIPSDAGAATLRVHEPQPTLVVAAVVGVALAGGNVVIVHRGVLEEPAIRPLAERIVPVLVQHLARRHARQREETEPTHHQCTLHVLAPSSRPPRTARPPVGGLLGPDYPNAPRRQARLRANEAAFRGLQWPMSERLFRTWAGLVSIGIL